MTDIAGRMEGMGGVIGFDRGKKFASDINLSANVIETKPQTGRKRLLS
jgi:hypothetical protein